MKMIYSQLIIKKCLLVMTILTKLLTDPNDTEDLLLYMVTQCDLLSLKQRNNRRFRAPMTPPGSASAAATVMLLIICLFMFIIISKTILSLKTPLYLVCEFVRFNASLSLGLFNSLRFDFNVIVETA